MESLFGNTFEQLGASLKAVLDNFSTSFSNKMNETMEEFTTKFSEMFAQMMSGFSQEFSEDLAQSLSSELDEILNSGLFDEIILQLELQLNQILSKFILVTSIPVVIAMVAVLISILNFGKIKKAALFDKRIEVYTALEFLCNCKNIPNTTENQIRLMKLEEQMLMISKAKFVFDENLTNQINDYAYSVYDLIINNENSSNTSDIVKNTDDFKTNVLPQIEKLVKI